MPLNQTLKPRVVIYDTQRKERFRHLEKDFKVTYSDPHYFKVPEMKYDYYWSDRERICDEYRRYTGVPHIDTLNQEKEVIEDAIQGKEEVEREEEKVEIGADEQLLDDEEESVDLESLNWHALAKKARDAGLEGKFNKEEAIEFLRKQ